MSYTRRSVLLAVVACAGLAAPVSAGDYTVPDQFATIQGAIDFAVGGDTIHVKPGTYDEVLTLSENIRIVSTGGPGVTTLTNEVDNQKTILTISGGVGNSASVEGFAFKTPADLALAISGNSSPRVVGCVFANWGVRPVTVNGGAPIFDGCDFHDINVGGDINGVVVTATDSNISFIGCTFTSNSAIFGATKGGAVYTLRGNPLFQTCTFTSNSIPLDSKNGGGAVFCDQSVSTFQDCVFKYNQGGLGAAIYAIKGKADIQACYFYNGNSKNGGGLFGTATDKFTVVNCIFGGNTSSVGGGAAIQYGSGTMQITNATMVGNSGQTEGACLLGQGGTIKCVNSIMFGSLAPLVFASDGGAVTVTYSNAQGGLPGAGNIDQDPRFYSYFNGDFRLGAGSPGIDAGNNNAAGLGDTDLLGHPRFVDDASTVDTGVGTPPIVDMGAYEFEGVGGGDCPPDFDHNGVLDLFDFLGFVNAFNAGC